MRAGLRHRGPDDEGLELVTLPVGYRLGLVHTRLAILDLSSAGHQPMDDPESGSWITYNGEVYNHQDIRQQFGSGSFRSSSDTETILRGWEEFGDGLLDRLRGMFAFALYDGRRHRLWLVRDRLGIKPLYVARVGTDTWAFASEIRALLASGLIARRFDSRAVDSYLAFGSVPAPWTLVADVDSVMPGESWCFDLASDADHVEPERVRYWRPPFGQEGGPEPSYADAVDELRPVLQEAVGLRMLSDVPVGVFLSGGIDSSSIVAVLASQGHRVRTFSVSFGERDLDESRHSRTIASRFHTEHSELRLRPEQVLDEFEQALAAYDQPSIDGLNTYFISQAVRDAGVKVALSGLGGDELFAGYSYFRQTARLEGRVVRLAANLMGRVMGMLNLGGIRSQKMQALARCNGSRLERYSIFRQVMLPDRRASLASAASDLTNVPLPPALLLELADAVQNLDAVNAHSLLELSLYMANMLLRDTDQMSMAHALEVRVPLLDHRLVESVARLPGHLKVTPGRSSRIKGLLVDALPVSLPEQVLRRPKMGFVLPWEYWLRQALRDRVAGVLSDEMLLANVGLNPAGVQSLWNNFGATRAGVRSSDVLGLLNLLTWAKQNRMTANQATDDLRVREACAVSL